MQVQFAINRSTPHGNRLIVRAGSADCLVRLNAAEPEHQACVTINGDCPRHSMEMAGAHLADEPSAFPSEPSAFPSSGMFQCCKLRFRVGG